MALVRTPWAFCRPALFLFLCVLTAMVIVSESGKMSVSRILLPIDTGTPTSYELHVIEGGCYTWTSSRPDLVKVQSDNSPSSIKATVTGVAKEHSQASVTIEARDPETGLTLLCQAGVVAVHEIRLKTVARELFLDDNPVAFEVRFI